MASEDLRAEKARLRIECEARRTAVHAAGAAAAAAAIANRGLAFLPGRHGRTASGFHSMGSEIDTRPLLERLAGGGWKLALPVVVGKGQPLVFRAWLPGDALGRGVWGIREPLPSAAEVRPDVVLAPLLAFDARGHRLGYGGGFYDRTLAALRRAGPVVVVGLAFDEQELADVPVADYDQRLDWVLTPSGARQFEG
ncbi:MAG: 5-formyltetrahydrofolate cyclo-ligase [Hyphomicrobiaceae bacterium]